MKKYFVIGNPIEHSLSPRLHNYWFKKNNIDAVYGKIKTNPGDIKSLILKVRNEKINGLLTKGYYNDKNATKELLKKDGLHTGDIAKKDINGNYFYIGREKDSVRVRGENISAWEIETTLNKKEFISESTILKTKAEIGENDIIALIIPKTNILNIKQIVKNCEKDLSKNYLPRYWCLMKKFPRTPSLRIDKKNINITKLKLYDRLIDKLIKIQRL